MVMLRQNLCCGRGNAPGTALLSLVYAAHNVGRFPSYNRFKNVINEGSAPLRLGAWGRPEMSTLAKALAFFSMATSEYMCVVSSETWPSQARMVLISMPARSRWTAVVCRTVCGLMRLEINEGTDAPASLA